MRPAVLLAVVLAALMPGQSFAQSPTLYFSAIPDDDETRLAERFGAVATYLADALGVPVAYVPVKSYPGAVTAFRNGQIQLGWFGGLSGVQARLVVPGSQALVQGDEDMEFVSYFIANRETGLTEAEAFPLAAEGMSFTFGAATSTSGRLFPEFYIREETGEAPDRFFSRVGFSGDHAQTLRLVASGAYQLGALNYTVYDAAEAAGAVETETTTVVWRTPPYPDYNFTIRGDADETFGAGFTERVREALLSMDDPALLASFPRARFVPAANHDYAPIEETARALGILD